MIDRSIEMLLTPKEEFVKVAMANGMTVGEIKARALEVFLQETMGKLEGMLMSEWWEGHQKCFIRSPPEDWSREEDPRLHEELNYFGYQGPEVMELAKKYYTTVPKLLETDLNNDHIVNILDISIVAVTFGTKVGDENWNETADLDKNGEINILDISKVAIDYGKCIIF